MQLSKSVRGCFSTLVFLDIRLFLFDFFLSDCLIFCIPCFFIFQTAPHKDTRSHHGPRRARSLPPAQQGQGPRKRCLPCVRQRARCHPQVPHEHLPSLLPRARRGHRLPQARLSRRCGCRSTRPHPTPLTHSHRTACDASLTHEKSQQAQPFARVPVRRVVRKVIPQEHKKRDGWLDCCCAAQGGRARVCRCFLLCSSVAEICVCVRLLSGWLGAPWKGCLSTAGRARRSRGGGA